MRLTPEQLKNMPESFKKANPHFYHNHEDPMEKKTETEALQIIPVISTDRAKLNKTEKAYLEHLLAQQHDFVGVQCLTFKLGDDCRYTPDFIFLRNGKLEAHEVKGFWRDDAKVKIKVAARMYSWIVFCVVMKNKDQWDVSFVNP